MNNNGGNSRQICLLLSPLSLICIFYCYSCYRYFMHWGKFNRIYKVSEKESSIFNYAWNKSLLVVNDLLAILEDNINSIENLRDIHPTFFNALLANNMIISDSEDEISSVKKHILSELYSKQVLRLTINPTLDCNLNCWYCYEKHNKEAYIDGQTRQSLYNFVQHQVSKGVQLVQLAFLGGEPLLGFHERAFPIIEAVKRICAEKGIDLKLHFTTNGVLLSHKVVDKISYFNIPTSFQIAFDGNQCFHDATKNFHGKGTFDTVLRNVRYALKQHFRINIRCNYTLSNVSSFCDLFDEIRMWEDVDKSLIAVSLQRIWQEKPTEELYIKARSLNEYICKLGFASNVANSYCANSYCYADYYNSYVVNYNGDVYKCTAREFNGAHKVGKINSLGLLRRTSEAYLPESKFKDYCDSCSLLPICTICLQTHMENPNGACPKVISDEDKEREIRNLFDAMYGKRIYC